MVQAETHRPHPPASRTAAAETDKWCWRTGATARGDNRWPMGGVDYANARVSSLGWSGVITVVRKS